MAVLTGKGAMTDVNLVARVYDNAVTKDGKFHYSDVQVDARDPRAKDQTNLHLRSQQVQDKDGNRTWNNQARYAASQLDQIKEAAGPNKEPILNKDGEQIGTDYGLKASLQRASDGKGLVINTAKELKQSDYKIDSKTMDRQYESMAAAKQAKDAQRQAQAEQPAPEQAAEAEAPQVEAEEPQVG